jgi:hypothetical protein
MIRGPRNASPTNNRERLRQDFTRSAPLRQIHPHLAEVRVEIEFQDGAGQTPSAQAFSYFPAARGFFRYACPCHSCSGQFDLSNHVAELAGTNASKPRTRNVDVACGGERARDAESREACQITARVRVSAIPRTAE